MPTVEGKRGTGKRKLGVKSRALSLTEKGARLNLSEESLFRKKQVRRGEHVNQAAWKGCHIIYNGVMIFNRKQASGEERVKRG